MDAQQSTLDDEAPPIPAPDSETGASQSLRLRGHVPALDGLRGLAILLVLFAHFTPQGQSHFLIGTIVKAISNVGSTGVDLFFVLSGFLITGILLDAKGSPHFFRNFYARRTLRIFPLYYGVLVICFLIVPLLRPFSPDEQRVAREQGWLWLYAANIRESFPNAYYPFSGGWIAMDHFWSLAIEEHFYLLWPLAIFAAGRRTMIGICLAVIAIAFGTRLGLYLSEAETMAFYQLTPCRMDELAMGGLIALLARGPRATRDLTRIAWVILPLSLIALTVTWRLEWREYVFGSSLLAIFFAALVVLVVTSGARNLLRLVFQNRWLRLLGKYSYAAYVLHPLIRSTIMKSLSTQGLASLTRSGFFGSMAFMMLGFTFSIAAAWLSWHLYEKHFLKLKRFFPFLRRAEDEAPIGFGDDSGACAHGHKKTETLPDDSGSVSSI